MKKKKKRFTLNYKNDKDSSFLPLFRIPVPASGLLVSTGTHLLSPYPFLPQLLTVLAPLLLLIT